MLTLFREATFATDENSCHISQADLSLELSTHTPSKQTVTEVS